MKDWFTDRVCERVLDETGGILEFCTISIDWLTIGLFVVGGWFVLTLLLNLLFSPEP